jgi:hypothetical protein
MNLVAPGCGFQVVVLGAPSLFKDKPLSSPWGGSEF